MLRLIVACTVSAAVAGSTASNQGKCGFGCGNDDCGRCAAFSIEYECNYSPIACEGCGGHWCPNGETTPTTSTTSTSSTSTSTTTSTTTTNSVVVAGALVVAVDDASAFAADAVVRSSLQDALARTLSGVESSWVVIEDSFVWWRSVRVEFEIMVPAGRTAPSKSIVETANFTAAIVQALEVKHVRFAVRGVRVVDVTVLHPPAATTTTTTTSMDVPPSNCPNPDNAYTCHFWGDPHFTHLFFMETNESEAEKGGRMMDAKKLIDFHPSGVFDLAESADGSFEAQVFFCPAHAGTTTGVGLAMRFGDDLVHVVRGAATAPKSENPSARDYWAVLNHSNEENVTEFYINGQRISFAQLGDANGTRGTDVSGHGGISAGSAFMQQMKTERESHKLMLPVCAGDEHQNLVEVSTPFFRKGWSDKWPVTYEHAVTIRSSNPGDSGLCSSDAKTLVNNGEKFRVDAKKNLFSSKQMKSLCSMCRLDMNDGACGAPGHKVAAKAVCHSAGGDYKAARKACQKEFEKGSNWFNTCVMETCASGMGAVAIAKIEEHFQREMIYPTTTTTTITSTTTSTTTTSTTSTTTTAISTTTPTTTTSTTTTEKPAAVIGGALVVVVDHAAAFVADLTVRMRFQEALAQALDGVESSWVVIQDIVVATHLASAVRVEFEIVVPMGHTAPLETDVETASYTEVVVKILQVTHMQFVVRSVVVVDVVISHPTAPTTVTTSSITTSTTTTTTTISTSTTSTTTTITSTTTSTTVTTTVSTTTSMTTTTASSATSTTTASTTTATTVAPEKPAAVIVGELVVIVDYAAAFIADVTVRTSFQEALAQALHGVEKSWVVIQDIIMATHLESAVRVEFEIVVPAGNTPPAKTVVETASYSETVVKILEVTHTRYVVRSVVVVDVAISYPTAPTTEMISTSSTTSTTTIATTASTTSMASTTTSPSTTSTTTTSSTMTSATTTSTTDATSTTTTTLSTTSTTTTTTQAPVTPTPQSCHTCLTTCAPCQACMGGPEGSFSFGSCKKCWSCWDWDDDELEDDDDDMDKDCDAMDKHHDWEDDEVRCLTNQVPADCRACWATFGVEMFV